MELEIEINKVGEERIVKSPQQSWIADEAQAMETAYFAGQEMIATQKSDSEPDVFELHYLGLFSSGFESMDHAKLSAPAFAQSVLDMLSQIITDVSDNG